MRKFRAGLRKYQIMEWIDALENGYGEKRTEQIQWATNSNLAAHMLDAKCLKTRLKRKFGIGVLEAGISDDCFKFAKNHISSVIHKIGKDVISRSATVRKNPDNHLSYMRGLEERCRTVTCYRLTSNGKRSLESLGKGVENQINRDYDSRDIKRVDSIIIPEYNDLTGWDTMKLDVPTPYGKDHISLQVEAGEYS